MLLCWFQLSIPSITGNLPNPIPTPASSEPFMPLSVTLDSFFGLELGKYRVCRPAGCSPTYARSNLHAHRYCFNEWTNFYLKEMIGLGFVWLVGWLAFACFKYRQFPLLSSPHIYVLWRVLESALGSWFNFPQSALVAFLGFLLLFSWVSFSLYSSLQVTAKKSVMRWGLIVLLVNINLGIFKK